MSIACAQHACAVPVICASWWPFFAVSLRVAHLPFSMSSAASAIMCETPPSTSSSGACSSTRSGKVCSLVRLASSRTCGSRCARALRSRIVQRCWRVMSLQPVAQPAAIWNRRWPWHRWGSRTPPRQMRCRSCPWRRTSSKRMLASWTRLGAVWPVRSGQGAIRPIYRRQRTRFGA